MDFACQHLFTGTVLARNKDIGIGRGHFFHQKAELLHGGAVSPIHVAGIRKRVAAFCRTPGIWAVGRRFCFRSRYGIQQGFHQFLVVPGFHDEVCGSFLDSPYGKVNVGISGEQHYGQGGTLLLYFMEPV